MELLTQDASGEVKIEEDGQALRPDNKSTTTAPGKATVS
jgi:hypothetical protein